MWISARSSSWAPAGSVPSGSRPTRRSSSDAPWLRPGRVGRAVLVADRGRRAPGHALERGALRPHGVREVRRQGSTRSRTSSGSAPDRPSGRDDRLHGHAHADRRDPLRPHDHAQGGRAVPRDHRRRERTATPGCGGRSARASVRITERAGSLFALGLWGPNAREVLSAVTDVDVGNDAFPYMTARYLNVGEVGPVWAQRISYAGELGWELYGQFAMGDRAWGLLWEAGQDRGLVAAGLGCRHAPAGGLSVLGQDIHTEHDPVPGRARLASRWTRRSSGREALERALERPSREARLSRSTTRPRRARRGADPIGRARRRLRDVRRLRLLGRALHRLRLPARRARCRARRSRSSTSTSGSRRRSPRTRCWTRRAND